MLKTGLSGVVCVLDDEPTTSGRHCGQIDPSLCQTQKVSFSTAVMIQPDSGPYVSSVLNSNEEFVGKYL